MSFIYLVVRHGEYLAKIFLVDKEIASASVHPDQVKGERYPMRPGLCGWALWKVGLFGLSGTVVGQLETGLPRPAPRPPSGILQPPSLAWHPPAHHTGAQTSSHEH